MTTIIRTPRLALVLGLALATIGVVTGCGKKDETTQSGYVPGTEATHKGGGATAHSSAIAKGVPAVSRSGKTKPGAEFKEQKATVLPPSNTVQTQGGGNLAL